MPAPGLPVDPIRADDQKKKKKEEESVEDGKGKGKANGLVKDENKEEELVSKHLSWTFGKFTSLCRSQKTIYNLETS
jgi:hypothetical protein